MDVSCEARHIAIGLADSNRETLSTLLSLLEDTQVVGIALDSARDAAESVRAKMVRWLGGEWLKAEARSATARIEAGAARIRGSQDSTELLRLRVWLHMWDGFGLEPEVPVSDRAIDSCVLKVGDAYAEYVARLVWDEEAKSKSFFSKDYWKHHGQYTFMPFRRVPVVERNFSQTFTFAFQRMIGGLAQGEDTETQREILDRAIEYLEGLDEKHKSELLAAANVEEISRESAMKILAIQGTLMGIGVATELAGFSAYILAAKASAIIPLVGGKTLVSTLAVLSNPVFIVPAILLVGGFFGSKAAGDILRFMGMNVITVLALRGVAAENRDVEPVVAMFRTLPELVPPELLESYRAAYAAQSRAEKGKELAKAAARLVWRGGKAAFDIPEYPDLNPYLKKWEVAMARTV